MTERVDEQASDRGRQDFLLEICVDSVAGVESAITGGADRIELCAALELGGLTPSAGLTAEAVARCRRAGVRVHAMVRPRAGGFDYDAGELATAVAEARALVAAGVDGLVFGACSGGRIDTGGVAAWLAGVAIDRPVALTFHRAIDVLEDPVAAVDAVVALGFDRILTSGGAPTAPEGAATIRAMVARAGDRCAIVAGSGVRAETLDAIVDATGVREVHASASMATASEAPAIAAMGFAIAPRRRTDADAVRALKNGLDNKTNPRH